MDGFTDQFIDGNIYWGMDFLMDEFIDGCIYW